DTPQHPKAHSGSCVAPGLAASASRSGASRELSKSRAFPERAPNDLSAIVAREVRDDLDDARELVAGEARLGVLLQLGDQRVAPLDALAQDHERLGHGEPLSVVGPDDRALAHRRVGREAILDLERAHEHAAHLQHVVAAARVIEVLALPLEEIRADDPLALEDVAGLGLVAPVAERRAVASDPEAAHLSVRDVGSVGADDA